MSLRPAGSPGLALTGQRAAGQAVTHGELARAYVVLRPGTTATQAEIIDHCRPHLAAY